MVLVHTNVGKEWIFVQVLRRRITLPPTDPVLARNLPLKKDEWILVPVNKWGLPSFFLPLRPLLWIIGPCVTIHPSHLVRILPLKEDEWILVPVMGTAKLLLATEAPSLDNWALCHHSYKSFS